MPGTDPGAGPGTHYELFAGLRAAGVSFLAGGSIALVLHGMPRLTSDVDLEVDGTPDNAARLDSLLAAWGYTVAPDAGSPAPARRYRHPVAALEPILVRFVPHGEFARLKAGAAAVALVDLDVPVVGAEDLRGLEKRRGTAAGRDVAADLEVLASIRAGAGSETGGGDTRREQIRKFSRWSVPARLDWLLTTARLERGLAPEARPLTRGLIRRRGWYGRR